MSQTSGDLSGRITDSRGNGIPNAVLIVTDASGNAQRVVCGPDGSFKIENLAPGSYRVELEANGSRRQARQNVEVRPGTTAKIEVTFEEPLSTGETGEVEIRAVAPTLQTESAEVSRSYGSRTIRSLPVLDRQHQELIGLMPGITPPVVVDDRILDPQRTRRFNVNGLPAFANTHYQDGTLNSETFMGQPARITPNEAVEALGVRTSNYNAEYGFAGGSWANILTRPGTNSVHGSLFGFHTNSFFATRNPLAPADVSPRFNVNQFGGTAGGPIIEDNMFWFVSYEGYLRRGNELRFATVPTVDIRAGNFAGFPTVFDPFSGSATTGAGRTPFALNRIPANRLNPAAVTLLSFIPEPNQPGLANNLVGRSMLLDDTHRVDLKLDHRFSNGSTGFVRYGFTHGSVDRGSILGLVGDAASSELRNHNAVASYSHNFLGAYLGEFRFGYSRYRNAIEAFDQSGLGFGNSADLLAGLDARGFSTGLPRIAIAGLSPLGHAINVPSRLVDNTYNGATNWMVHNGIHTFKLGLDVRHIRASGFDPGFFGPRGSFAFGPSTTVAINGTAAGVDILGNSFAAFLTGAPSVAGVSTFLETPNARQTQWAAYATDTINLLSILYLEVGVRWDAYSPFKVRNPGAAVIFDPATGAISFAGQNGIDSSGGIDWDWNNIAPRIGLALRPSSRLAIRGGYGIHYFPVPLSLSPINFTSVGSQAGLTGAFARVPFSLPASLTPGGIGVAANQPFFVRSSSKPDTPYVQTFSAMIQADLSEGFLFDIGYVGTLGRQLPFQRVINAAEPGTGLTGLPLFTLGRTATTIERGTGLNSSYNSLQVNLTKRFSKGLAFAGAYTFSKALDRGTDLFNPFDANANYAVADWDRTHVLSVSHVWNLPFGPGTPYFTDGIAAQILGSWELNGVLRWATGTPFTVTADPLFCACPGLTSIPASFARTVAINGSSSFDPALFRAPLPNSFGDIGRNQFRGPDLFTYNLSLFRNFPVRDRFKLELRGEVYNLTNSTNFANPVATLGAPGFGQSLQTFNGQAGRQFQVGARVLF